MQHIQSEIEIAAAPERIWRVLTDFAAYSSWNPFIRNLSGQQTVGARLDVTIQPDGGSPMSFKPKLLVFEPQKELRWKGQVLMPGVFDGEHCFRLAETSPGRVRLTQSEKFSGVLVPFLMRGAMLAGTER